MITLRYQKTDAFKFVSHIDVLRHMERIIRRAEIEVTFSQGFNPHPNMYFSPPVVLGIGSTSEYVAFDTYADGEELMRRYNHNVPEGLGASAHFRTVKNPNLAGIAVAAEYIFPVQWENNFEAIMSASALPTLYTAKGEEKTEDLRPKIFGVREHEGKLCMRLAAGNTNLRADRAAAMLKQHFGAYTDLTRVVKTELFVSDGAGTVSAEQYLLRGTAR